MTKYILDDDVAAFVAKCEAFYDQASINMGITEMRRIFSAQCDAFRVPHPVGISTRDDHVTGPAGSIPIRIYRPVVSNTPGCLIYFHGGGWVLGDLESHDSITAEIASRAGIVVIAVDYRLAPEHRYPAALDDGWAVVQAVANNPAHYGIDPSRLAVGGDSAGANIAAAMALMARDHGGPQLVAQVLLYAALGGMGALPSYDECSDAPLLSTATMQAFHKLYFGSRDLPDDPLACPLKADSLEGLPPAFLSAAQYDPLRDDSIDYARRLEAAGTAVELHVEEGLIHAFLRTRHVTRRGKEAFDRICHGIKRLM